MTVVHVILETDRMLLRRFTPDDLAATFDSHPDLARRYEQLAPRGKKQVLWAVVSAKRPATRVARIERLVSRARGGEPLVP